MGCPAAGLVLADHRDVEAGEVGEVGEGLLGDVALLTDGCQTVRERHGGNATVRVAFRPLVLNHSELGLRLPAKNRKAGADIRGRLQRLGVIRESGHEHFNGSLTVPIFNPDGQVMEMYGRKVTRALRAGTPDHLYLPALTVGSGTRRACAPRAAR